MPGHCYLIQGSSPGREPSTEVKGPTSKTTYERCLANEIIARPKSNDNHLFERPVKWEHWLKGI